MWLNVWWVTYLNWNSSVGCLSVQDISPLYFTISQDASVYLDIIVTISGQPRNNRTTWRCRTTWPEGNHPLKHCYLFSISFMTIVGEIRTMSETFSGLLVPKGQTGKDGSQGRQGPSGTIVSTSRCHLMWLYNTCSTFTEKGILFFVLSFSLNTSFIRTF